MSNYFHELLTLLPFTALPWMVLAISMHIDRSRYRNCMFLFVALLVTFPFLFALFGPAGDIAAAITAVAIVLMILALPIALMWNGVLMIRREGRSLANLLSLLTGILIFIGEASAILWVFAFPFRQAQARSVLKGLVVQSSTFLCFLWLSIAYGAFCFSTFALYTLFLQRIPHRARFDYVIIHGAGLLHGDQVSKLLADRIDKAIQVYQKSPTPPILIPSGGMGGNETVAEATAMTQYLLDHGIPGEHILPEARSTTTYENLVCSREIIERDCLQRNLTNPRVAIVTNNYHVYRALRYCRKMHFRCTGIGSRVAPYYWPSALIREFVAIHKEVKHLILFVLGWLIAIAPMLYEVLQK